MGSKKDYGYSGFLMVQRNLKENLAMVKEIVFGPPGTKMEIKNFKLHIRMGNLMDLGHHGIMGVL